MILFGVCGVLGDNVWAWHTGLDWPRHTLGNDPQRRDDAHTEKAVPRSIFDLPRQHEQAALSCRYASFIKLIFISSC